MMENILLKLNVKGGGHNYNVKPEIFAYVIFLRCAKPSFIDNSLQDAPLDGGENDDRGLWRCPSDRSIESWEDGWYTSWSFGSRSTVWLSRTDLLLMFQFSFNGGVSPDSFIGDYHFQQPTKERVSELIRKTQRKEWAILRFTTMF